MTVEKNITLIKDVTIKSKEHKMILKFINKFVTPQFAIWNICIFGFGVVLGMINGTNEYWLNLLRHGLGFCGKAF